MTGFLGLGALAGSSAAVAASGVVAGAIPRDGTTLGVHVAAMGVGPQQDAAPNPFEGSPLNPYGHGPFEGSPSSQWEEGSNQWEE